MMIIPSLRVLESMILAAYAQIFPPPTYLKDSLVSISNLDLTNLADQFPPTNMHCTITSTVTLPKPSLSQLILNCWTVASYHKQQTYSLTPYSAILILSDHQALKA